MCTYYVVFLCSKGINMKFSHKWDNICKVSIKIWVVSWCCALPAPPAGAEKRRCGQWGRRWVCGPAGSETPVVIGAPVRFPSESAAAAQDWSVCSQPGGQEVSRLRVFWYSRLKKIRRGCKRKRPTVTAGSFNFQISDSGKYSYTFGCICLCGKLNAQGR